MTGQKAEMTNHRDKSINSLQYLCQTSFMFNGKTVDRGFRSITHRTTIVRIINPYTITHHIIHHSSTRREPREPSKSWICPYQQSRKRKQKYTPDRQTRHGFPLMMLSPTSPSNASSSATLKTTAICLLLFLLCENRNPFPLRYFGFPSATLVRAFSLAPYCQRRSTISSTRSCTSTMHGQRIGISDDEPENESSSLELTPQRQKALRKQVQQFKARRTLPTFYFEDLQISKIQESMQVSQVSHAYVQIRGISKDDRSSVYDEALKLEAQLGDNIVLLDVQGHSATYVQLSHPDLTLFGTGKTNAWTKRPAKPRDVRGQIIKESTE